MREIESRGVSVDAAINEGLRRLALSRDEVEIEILDEGSRGLLGIGSREAVVRIRQIGSAAVEAPALPVVVEPPTRQAEPKPTAPISSAQPPTPKPAGKAKPSEITDDADETVSDAELAEEADVAIAVLDDLLSKMHVEAEITAELTEPDDLTGQRVNLIAITGDDLGILIGPRGETLDALQFLARLMVAHQIHRRANFVIDIEGYRQRRQQALARLAERMADKARQRGQPVSLEPMSSYERRVIHMALRDVPDVYTESTGEGKHRKVRIYPKR